MARVLIFLLACCILPALSAEVQTWTDETGQTYFGDHPPPTVAAKKYHLSEVPPDQGAAAEGIHLKQELTSARHRQQQAELALEQLKLENAARAARVSNLANKLNRAK